MMRRAMNVLLAAFEKIGADEGDAPDVLLKKRSLVALGSLISIPGMLWGAMYLVLDEPLAASIPFAYSALSLGSIGVFAVTRRYGLFQVTQLALILLLPFLLMITLGGFINSSAVIIWSLMAPLTALLVSGRRQATFWFLAYVGLIVLSRLLQPYVRPTNNLSTGSVLLFFALNILGPSLVAFLLLQYFVGQRDRAMALLGREREKSERLLLNILPSAIAATLKEEQRTIAEHHPEASVLFADVVGFTPLSAELAPDEMVELLNEVFTYFDDLCARHGVEKIRTIGDNYMVASGVPVAREDHALVMARMALEMNAFAANTASSAARRLRFRFGINSGPLVAGVIGHSKFQYDIWGDTVNLASRMESHGVPGKIQISEATYRLVLDDFVCEPRGIIDVKGKGPMQTWFLIRPHGKGAM